ncbi:hypothetical protein M407DRAFT_84392 [Tulasnella calospora MUT 4182]|uniref:Sodium/calcium exchanger membrane region domain-containing protein n=1 Tax=Tulasnella calospora MUT 4182 TaxID=1051891 RepID=A0A0C3Q477_9AGAM|nr:hypothetical protein M407DRAFT_84392 [Tulasnella calospora MUT 4182]
MKSLAPGWWRSIVNVAFASCKCISPRKSAFGIGSLIEFFGVGYVCFVGVHVLVFVLPFSWIAHFQHWSMTYTLLFSILGLIPLAHIFEFVGEQIALYCGQTLGDLIVITLSNSIEVVLAVMLLLNCELRLAQATIAGVVLLHLLLVPGCAFLTGGAKIWYQQLGEHSSQLNQSLLAAGFIFILIPTVFFSAIGSDPHLLDPHVNVTSSTTSEVVSEHARRGLVHAKRVWMTTDLTGADAVSDETRGVLLQISRGMAVIMLIIYIASRVYLHNPPGDKETKRAVLAALSPTEREDVLDHSKPLVNPGVCILFLVTTAMVMTLTIEWLVDSIPEYYQKGWITEEWLGLILLPITSFAADAMLVTVYFIKTLLRRNPPVPEGIAHGRSIDLSVQFLLFWMPFIVIVAWILGKPFSLLFDIFELACIFGGCFLVNYITQDSKTNWAEGLVMILTYVMIESALVAWYYPSQRAHSEMMACTTSVLGAVMGEEADHGL